MLKQRVITALVLAAVFLGVLFLFPPLAFAAFAAVAAAIAAWEWANLCHLTSTKARLIYAFVILGVGGGLLELLRVSDLITLDQLLLLSCVWWAVALLFVQGYPSSVILWRHQIIRMVMGALVLIPGFIALIHLRNLANGQWLVIAVVLLVAAADIGAYFSGRRFGRHKLAPQVSPGKSWEGVAGGVLAVAVLSIAYALSRGASVGVILALALPAALVSVVGDLLESMLKRFRGIKDSGQILPGHGGVLDRIDGLVAAVPVFTLAVITANRML